MINKCISFSRWWWYFNGHIVKPRTNRSLSLHNLCAPVVVLAVAACLTLYYQKTGVDPREIGQLMNDSKTRVVDPFFS